LCKGGVGEMADIDKMGLILNAFSINMLNNFPCAVLIEDITDYILKEDIKVVMKKLLDSGYKSYVGHADLANLIGVPFNRESVTMEKGDIAIVVQYRGERLPEGATELPENSELRIYKVTIE